MENPEVYIPMDRRHAIALGKSLPERAVGAALFADISGFTQLTAALLQELGIKRGSEELPRLLNLVYDALISEIHRFGGSVIGFAGDAITCWLNNDDGTQAVACGLAMQTTMAQFESTTTPAGTAVSLGLKVAIAVGPVRRFLVGDPNIQQLDTIAGATLDRMADAEHHAERGDVVVTAEVVEQIGHKLDVLEVRTDAESGLQYTIVNDQTEAVAPNIWPPLPNALSDEDVRPWLLPPVYHKLQSKGGEFLAEVRPSVALFLRFGGINFDADPQAGTTLDAYVRWVQHVLQNYEAYLMDVTIGDKGCYLYCNFGSPALHDDDPARAVAAALDIQNPPAELSDIGAVQIGISQGRMRAGAFGSRYRRVYGSLGNEVNMAARLMSRAKVGQTMISQRVADAVVGLYELQHLGQIEIKGRDEPLSVALVLGREQVNRSQVVNQFPTPLVGRSAELAELAQVLAGADASQTGQLLRIEGVAGIGKSHLSTAFARQAAQLGWEVVIGSCHSINQNISYHPWQQIFRHLFGLVGADAEQLQETVRQHIELINPEWLVRLPLLGDLLELPIPDNATTAAFEPQLRQEALFTFAIDLIQHWASARPLLLLVEDAHWLDEASRNLVVALSRVAEQSRLVLAVVHRPPIEVNLPILPEFEPLPNYHKINLDELNGEGVAAIIANRLGAAPSLLLLDLIMVQARGNPFFVEEMTDTLREAGHLAQQEDGRWTLTATLTEALSQANCLTYNQDGQMTLNSEIPLSAADLGLPDSIQQVVLSRLDRLLEDQRLTLKVASVIGRVFEFNLLARAHPVEENQEKLLKQIEIIEEREFARLEIPIPHLTHLFKHSITRDVAYETLLESQQRELHQTVAEAMEESYPEAVEQLAYHYTRARVTNKAVTYLGLSAQKAQREYANETALAFYEQVLSLEENWAWRKGQIEVLHLLGRRDEEKVALEALEKVPDAPAFEVAYLWGQYYEAIADYPQAQVAVVRALEAARTSQNRLSEIQSLGQLGLIARRRGNYAAAKDWYERALVDFDESEEFSLVQASAYTQILNGLGITFRQQGKFDQAQVQHELALSLCARNALKMNEAQTLNLLGVKTYYQRNLIAAQEYYLQALSIMRIVGDRAGEATGLYNLALIKQELGDYAQAQAYFNDALTNHQAVNNRWEEINVWIGLGILNHELGNHMIAQRHFEQSLKLSEEVGDEAGEGYALCNLGLLSYDLQSLSTAEAYLSKGLGIAQSQNDSYLESSMLSYLNLVNLELGHSQQVITHSEKVITMRNELGLRPRLADDYVVLALAHLALDEVPLALANLEESLAILNEDDGSGAEFPQRNYFIGYEVLNAVGQRERAVAALQSAYELVMTRANKITEPLLRQTYLHQVTINRKIVTEYESLDTTKT